MITADDVQFHIPSDVAYDWAETNFFSVYLPEPNIAAWIYTVARPGNWPLDRLTGREFAAGRAR